MYSRGKEVIYKDDTKALINLLEEEHGLTYTFHFPDGVTYYLFDLYFSIAVFIDKEGKGFFIPNEFGDKTYEGIIAHANPSLPYKKAMWKLLTDENDIIMQMYNARKDAITIDKDGNVTW